MDKTGADVDILKIAKRLEAISIRRGAGLISPQEARDELSFYTAILKALDLHYLEQKLQTLATVLQDRRK